MHPTSKWDRRAHRSASDYQKRPLLYYVWRRLRWTLGDRSPYFAYIKLTRRCNLTCTYCPWKKGAVKTDDELSTDQWKSVFSDLAAQGVEIFILEGGEPTLRPDLQILIDHLRSLGLVTIVGSNGTTKPWKFRPTAFTVSIDGPPEVHDSIRGQGSFDRLLANLQVNPGVPVATITVVNKNNVAHLEEMLLRIMPYVNASGFTFQYPYSTGSELALDSKAIREASAEILRLKKDSRFRILNPTVSLKKQNWTCYSETTISVDYQGHISHGCFVEHIEPPKCDQCQLACYRLISALHVMNFEAWFNLHRHFLRHM